MPIKVWIRGRSASPSASPALLDVLVHSAGQPANYRPGNFLPNAAHGLKILVGGHRKAGLDNIDLQPRQLVGDFQLFPDGQRGTGRLLGVPQRGVENVYAICISHDVFFPRLAG